MNHFSGREVYYAKDYRRARVAYTTNWAESLVTRQRTCLLLPATWSVCQLYTNWKLSITDQAVSCPSFSTSILSIPPPGYGFRWGGPCRGARSCCGDRRWCRLPSLGSLIAYARRCMDCVTAVFDLLELYPLMVFPRYWLERTDHERR